MLAQCQIKWMPWDSLAARSLLGMVLGFVGVGSGAAAGAAAPAQTVAASAAVTIPPLPPFPACPATEFRALLAKSPAEREEVLAARRPDQREVLRRKIPEYEAMPAEERELKITMLELHWYLERLTTVTPGMRYEPLKSVPEPLRPVVNARLRLWDQYPPEEQARMRKFESIRHWWTRVESLPQGVPGTELTNLPPARQMQIEALEHLQAMAPSEREAMINRLAKLFELDATEKKAVLERLPESDRQPGAASLSALSNLPNSKRQTVIAAFKKFSQLEPQEQRQFMSNYERWQSMPPQERQVWRVLVDRLPPLPPGFRSTNTPPVPLPPRSASSASKIPIH